MDMNSEQKNLAYWFSLPLWPLDSACRLLCGADVNDPDQAPLSMRDPATRPEWVNLHNLAVTDDESPPIENGKGGARGVAPVPFIKWARSKGYGLDSKFDVLLANNKTAKQQRQDALAVELDVILGAMKNPTPAKVMGKLRKLIGKSNTCITANVGDGIQWERDNGNVETLSINALSERIKNWKKKQGEAKAKPRLTG